MPPKRPKPADRQPPAKPVAPPDPLVPIVEDLMLRAPVARPEPQGKLPKPRRQNKPKR
jgi:hypothetical protein